MPRDERHTQTIPYGTLGIVPLASCSGTFGKKVNNYLVDWREQRDHEDESTLAFSRISERFLYRKRKAPRVSAPVKAKGELTRVRPWMMTSISW